MALGVDLFRARLFRVSDEHTVVTTEDGSIVQSDHGPQKSRLGIIYLTVPEDTIDDAVLTLDNETFSGLSLADSVALGLGPQIIQTVDRAMLSDPEPWVIEIEEFRAHTGPFSSFDVLRSLDEYTVKIGEHPHCAGPPQPPPNGLKELRRVSVQPLGDSMDSCLDWTTVDLFVDPSGQVEAVTMDLWEP